MYQYVLCIPDPSQRKNALRTVGHGDFTAPTRKHELQVIQSYRSYRSRIHISAQQGRLLNRWIDNLSGVYE